MMNHHLPAVPPSTPNIPRRPGGRHPNDHFQHHGPIPGANVYQYPHHPPQPHLLPHQHQHTQPYPPPQYRSWTGAPSYAPYGMTVPAHHHQQPQPQPPPPHLQYPNAPLVVSSYPHSQPPPLSAVLRQPSARTASPSTHSQVLISPTTSSTTSAPVMTPPLTASTSSLRVPTPPPARLRFCPPLPWYSVPNEPFPPRVQRRRRRRAVPQASDSSVELPAAPQDKPDALIAGSGSLPSEIASAVQGSKSTPTKTEPPAAATSKLPLTSTASLAPRDMIAQPSLATIKAGPRQILPAIPLSHHTANKSQAYVASTTRETKSSSAQLMGTGGTSEDTPSTAVITGPTPSQSALGDIVPPKDETPKVASPPVSKAAPKSWADLVRSNAPKSGPTTNGIAAVGLSSANVQVQTKASPLVDVLRTYTVDKTDGDDGRLSFLQPRGLVNTGNMCYMNAVLQCLVFCVPFHAFLDSVGRQATHCFKTETPLLDAMIMFIREFPVIDSAISVEQLRLRLKDSELEQYGEAFIPEFVYEVIRRLPRFASMRRGHQQDAEEFLGFLLEELHEECARALGDGKPSPSVADASTPTSGLTSPTRSVAAAVDGGWLEVGPKQKSSITRSSGMIATESPITKIFGGKQRSELRVTGKKNSVTLEPYQSLQLDIQSASVNNITDALKGMTRSEVLHGDFKSPRGPNATATKQVFIETLPPVLILHLKRFQYDNTGGTQKIWKKVGYPLQLEIPKEAFPQHRRGALAAHGGLPQYRLIGVIYHHGQTASGGHYTVDVRRQDGREWVRLDDTVIRRLRSQDVAAGGAEEDPKVRAAALAIAPRVASGMGNIFDHVGDVESETSSGQKGWHQVNGTSVGETAVGYGKSSSGSVNGSTSPPNGKSVTVDRKSSLKDGKVAYLLFYQKM